MDEENISEDTNDIQFRVVNMRKKYPKTMLKYYEQNSKMELKLLEKQRLNCETKFEPPKDFVLDDNLLSNLNEELLDREKIILVRNKLRNLNKIILQNFKMRNCGLYNLINEKSM